VYHLVSQTLESCIRKWGKNGGKRVTQNHTCTLAQRPQQKRIIIKSGGWEKPLKSLTLLHEHCAHTWGSLELRGKKNIAGKKKPLGQGKKNRRHLLGRTDRTTPGVYTWQDGHQTKGRPKNQENKPGGEKSRGESQKKVVVTTKKKTKATWGGR